MRIVGLKRTGNHAITTWILEQQKLTGKVAHLNNVKVNENPYRCKYQNLIYYYPEYKRKIEQYRKQGQGNFIPRDCLIYSYEDYPLEHIFTQDFERKHDLYLGRANQRYDILIVRDPFNLFASRLKINFLKVKSKQYDFVDLWIQYAKEYLGETNYLKHNKIVINYNLWTSSIEYRQQLAQKLNIEFTDAGIDKVHGCGGGSSFDRITMNGQGDRMDISNRWKHFIGDRHYLEIFKNQELLKYSSKIFGHIEGTEVLFDRSENTIIT
jgi:hypothetical protein